MKGTGTTWRPRLTLSTMLLLVTLLAIAMSWHRTHQRLVTVRSNVASMQRLARELRVEDPDRIAAITRMPTLPREMVIDIHIPDVGPDHPPLRLCLVLENIIRNGTLEEQFPEPLQSQMIEPGRHQIEIRHDMPDSNLPGAEHEVSILLDGQVAFEAKRPPNWQPSNGWSSSGTMSEVATFDSHQPVELHRRRFNMKTAAGFSSVKEEIPTSGILLWIEPDDRQRGNNQAHGKATIRDPS